MSDETNDEFQNSTTSDAESDQSTTETTDTEASGEVDVQALQAENRKLYARAKKAEDEAKKLRKPVESQQTESQPVSIPNERLERLELKTEGYSTEEVDEIMDLGGRKALENPVVSEAIRVMRNKAKSVAATVTGTAKSPIYQKYSERDLLKMPLNELEQIIPQD